MEDKNFKQLLRDSEQIPNESLFKEILSGPLFQTYLEIQNIFTNIGLSSEWRYYNDGKSWLCKVTHKKKTIVWISLWEFFFKAGFYFNEKNRGGIKDLDINQKNKDTFEKAQPIGKLFPLTLDIKNINDLNDFKKIIEYKINII
jgi:hypothetical protein